MKAPHSALWIISAGIAVLLGMVAWLIRILSGPAFWCGVTVGAAKISDQRPLVQDCTNILLSLIGWLGWISMGLLATAALAFIVVTITDRKASIDVHGPGGIGLKAGGDEPVPVEVRNAPDHPVPTEPR